MSEYDLLNALQMQLGALRSGSLCFWGNWFGRPFDNIHRIVGVDALDGTIAIFFDHGESLIIESPRNWSLADGCLSVAEADRIRFQWFYYGRLPSRETLQFEEYRLYEDRLTFATDFQPDRKRELTRTLPAVQLHSLS